MTHKTITAKTFDWYHFNKKSEVEFDFLEKTFKFHHLDYEDVRSETPISKLDLYKHYAFIVFHIPKIDKVNGRVYGIELNVFLSSDSLVTISSEPIAALESFQKSMANNSKLRNATLGKGPAFLLYKLLQYAFRDAMPIISELTAEVSRLEDEIRHGHDKRTTVELGTIRRNVLFMRHIVDPQRNMFTTLSTMRRPFMSPDLTVYFDDVHDILDAIWLTCDNLKLIIDGLFDVNEALLSHKTNEVVTILTLLSAGLMAPTLIAGFYGMNVSWLPGANDPSFVGFLYIISLLIIIAFATYVIRRGRK
jgi:magnesium transporter